MKEVKLTDGRTALADDEDYDNKLQYFSWSSAGRCRHPNTHTAGRHRYMHHMIIGKPPNGFVVHHKDGNVLNNQKSNLEIITKKDHYTKHSNTGHYGISITDKGKFRVIIFKNKIRCNIGTYSTLEKAKSAYNFHA